MAVSRQVLKVVLLAGIWISTKLLATAFISITLFSWNAPASQAEELLFYQRSYVGSEQLFNPLNSFLQYSLDSVQIRKSFGTGNYNDHLDEVLGHLGNPRGAIREEGGYDDFIHKEVLPIYPERLHESKSILPNIGLHFFGGGYLYRKNAEWLTANGWSHPWFTSGALAMTAEILQEAIEKPTTDATDEVADVFIYRPLGIWFFHDKKRAEWVKRNFDPVDWPHLMLYDVEQDQLLNTGISYVLRPAWFANPDTRFFAYIGLSNLFGLSHRLENGAQLSWGLGESTQSIKPTEIRASAGVFYDRQNSLLWSVILNGTEQLRLRANVYPGFWFHSRVPVGFFLGLSDDNNAAAGINFGLPIGIGVRGGAE